jgi:hypothetical protein
MKLVMTLDEVLEACEAYLRAKGFEVEKSDLRIEKRTWSEGEYDDYREYADLDGVSAEIKKGAQKQQLAKT